jgi:Cu+-exporting ATPase
LNGNGALVMRAEKVGSDTILSQIVQLVAQAQRSRAPMQRMADKVSFSFVLAVFAVAIATLLVWGFFGPEPSWTFAVVNTVAVLIIACPCALGLATPMSIMVATGRAAQAGVLFRDAEAIERLRTIDTLIVDKTGTLTQGRPRFRDVIGFGGTTQDEVVRLAASLDQGSEHPLAAAIVAEARRRGLTLSPPEDFESATGIGVRGRVDGQAPALGNTTPMQERGADVASIDGVAERRRSGARAVRRCRRPQGCSAPRMPMRDPAGHGRPGVRSVFARARWRRRRDRTAPARQSMPRVLRSGRQPGRRARCRRRRPPDRR